jgi:hypothetical protein
MKLKKRITSGIFCMAAAALLAVMLLFGACDTPLSPGDTLEYDVLSGGAGVRITRLSYIGAPQSYTIPDLIEGLPVIEIAPSAFYAASLSSIDIPDTVTRIGSRDSGSTGDSLNGVFNPSLKNITIYVSGGTPGGFFSVDGVLYDDATPPTELIYCPGDKSGTFTIPLDITDIAKGAFEDCRGITAFAVETGNTAFDTENGVLFDIGLATLIRFPPGKSGPYIASDYPPTADTIFEKAFYGCHINSVEIPTGMLTIGEQAFAYCKSLTRIKFEDSTPPTIGLAPFFENGTNWRIQVPTLSKTAYLLALGWGTALDYLIEEY